MPSRSKSRRRAAAAGDLMLAPMVAWMRLPLMVGETGKPSSARSETISAVSEKAAAAAEGIAAAQLSMMGSMMSFWPEIMSGRTPSLLNGVAIERSMHAALRPTRRRVKANFRRLGTGG